MWPRVQQSYCYHPDVYYFSITVHSNVFYSWICQWLQYFICKKMTHHVFLIEFSWDLMLWNVCKTGCFHLHYSYKVIYSLTSVSFLLINSLFAISLKKNKAQVSMLQLGWFLNFELISNGHKNLCHKNLAAMLAVLSGAHTSQKPLR